MNIEDVKHFLRRKSIEYKPGAKGWLSVPCLLSKWKHAKGTDSHASAGIKINSEGVCMYNCFTCKSKGTLAYILDLMSRYDRTFIEDAKIFRDENDNSKKKSLSRFVEYKTKSCSDKFKNKYDFGCQGSVDEIFWTESDLKNFSIPSYWLAKLSEKLQIPIECLINWEIGWDRQQQRVTFPIRRRDGKIVGIVGRSFTDEKKRYKNYPGMKAGKYLYGESFISIDKREPIFVVEGMRDAILLSIYRETVGFFGAYVTEEKVKRILHFNRPVVILGDGDKVGREFNRELYESLHGKTPCRFIDLPDKSGKKDVCDYGLDGILEIIEGERCQV